MIVRARIRHDNVSLISRDVTTNTGTQIFMNLGPQMLILVLTTRGLILTLNQQYGDPLKNQNFENRFCAC